MAMTNAENAEKEVMTSSEPASAPEIRRRRRPVPKPAERDVVDIVPDDIRLQGGDAKFAYADPIEQRRKEIREIEKIIEYNLSVREKNKGDFKTITAILTSSNETRSGSSHTTIESVTLYAYQVLPGNTSYGQVKLVLDGRDFTAYTARSRSDSEPISENARRTRQYTNHALMSKFTCVPVKISYDENDTEHLNPSVYCSRSLAMEQQQNRYFFSKKPLAKKGGHLFAFVMSVNPNGVRVEAGGVETFIPRGELTARQFILDPTKYYQPGDVIDVTIKELEVDEEDRTVRIVLSGLMREVELGLVMSVREFDLAKKPHEVAQCISLTDKFIIVRLMRGVIGIIRKEDVRGGGEVAIGDNVLMEVTGINVESNRVVGTCFKV